jgi:hypothetical protein
MYWKLGDAIAAGDISSVRLLFQRGANITGALHHAVCFDRNSIVEWLLAEGGVNTSDMNAGRDTRGFTALLVAANIEELPWDTTNWLFENGGAHVRKAPLAGQEMWNMLRSSFMPCANIEQWAHALRDQLIAMLRVMVLQSAPPANLVVQMSTEHSRVAEKGARLLARFPAYLAQRRALLSEHTSLIAPLEALVSSYEEPTTTEELWATGLG